MKIKPEDLDKISERMRSSTVLRDGAGRVKITVHMGTCGIASGAREILRSFMDKIEESNTTDIICTTTGCAGLCSKEPMATVELRGDAPVKYVELTEEKVGKIFEEHIMNNRVVADYALVQGSERIS